MTTGNITIGRTEYLVERAGKHSDTFYLTGPRGGTKIAVPYSNNPNLYHAFSRGGTFPDLKVNGQVARIDLADLEAAVAE